jgi:hypothetical protein
VIVVTALALSFSSFSSPWAVIVAIVVTVPLAFVAVFTTIVTLLIVPSGTLPRSQRKTTVDSVTWSHDAPGALVSASTGVV